MSYVDSAERGAENLVHDIAQAKSRHLSDGERLGRMLTALKTYPLLNVNVEDVANGQQISVGCRMIPLGIADSFNFAHDLSLEEPMVLGVFQGKPFHGMLSANFDSHGHDRLSSLRLFPFGRKMAVSQVLAPDKTKLLIPHADTFVRLAGGVSLERQGVGGHANTRLDAEPEHAATILGAISMGNTEIARTHANHRVRTEGSSVATGLSNGQLGNVFTDHTSNLLSSTKFQPPIIIEKSLVTDRDMILIPEGFIESPDRSFGARLSEAIDPTRLLMGMAHKSLLDRGINVRDQMLRMADAMEQTP